MVLEDTGSPPPESFNEDPYPSENDNWSSPSPLSSSGYQSKYNYDSSKFPQPIPIIGPLVGYTPSIIRWRVDDTLKFAEKAIHRPLTEEEAAAFASHLYAAEQERSYFTTAGLGIGIWRWHVTKHKNSYPFYTPKPGSWDPNKFFVLRGPLAYATRSAFRGTIWAAFGMAGVSILGGIYTNRKAALAAAEDPRLQDIRNSLKERGQKKQPPYGTNPLGGEAPARPDGQLPPHAGAPRWGRTPPPPPRAPVQSEGDDDDMSPTAGNEPWSASGDSSWSSAPAEPQQTQTPQQVLQQRKQQRPQPKADYYDDASPTGGMFREETQLSQDNVSAWERLRRGGGAPTESAQQGEKSDLGDSWTFAESNKERQRAQEKAQREFDARIERERQGKDFNDEKRW